MPLCLATTLALTAAYVAPVEEIALTFDLDPCLIHAVIYVESYGDPLVVGSIGERSLGQITPDTAALIENNTGVPAASILNEPFWNIYGIGWYLRWLLNFFDGDVNKALAGYNWGPGNVQHSSTWPPIVHHYVRKVRNYWRPAVMYTADWYDIERMIE